MVENSMTDVRNPKYNAQGTIDIELNHPTYGWVSFTASPDDPEEYGRELYELAVSGEFGEILNEN
jgi:hypothetical protein